MLALARVAAALLLTAPLASAAGKAIDEEGPAAHGGKGFEFKLDMDAEWRDGRPRRATVPEAATTYVLIASYRDERCGRTLFDMFMKAKYPDRAFAAVGDQIVVGEDTPCVEVFCNMWEKEFPGGGCPHRDQVITLHIDAKDAKGPVYGRGRVNMEILPRDHGDFCLQVDSHTFFLQNWDAELIEEWRSVDNEYAVLSTYAPGHGDLATVGKPNSPSSRREVPHLCRTLMGERGIPRNTVAAVAYRLPRPKLTNTWGAGLSYAKCHYERRVPNDPRLYHVFDGEEWGRWMRGFAAGYDTYTLSRTIVFHDYTPVPHHWGALHREYAPGQKTQGEEKEDAMRLVRALFRIPHDNVADEVELGPFGLQQCRTYEQMVQFGGVDPRVGKMTEGEKCGQLHWVPFADGCVERVDRVWEAWWDALGQSPPRRGGTGRAEGPSDAAAADDAANSAAFLAAASNKPGDGDGAGAGANAGVNAGATTARAVTVDVAAADHAHDERRPADGRKAGKGAKADDLLKPEHAQPARRAEASPAGDAAAEEGGAPFIASYRLWGVVALDCALLCVAAACFTGLCSGGKRRKQRRGRGGV